MKIIHLPLLISNTTRPPPKMECGLQLQIQSVVKNVQYQRFDFSLVPEP